MKNIKVLSKTETCIGKEYFSIVFIPTVAFNWQRTLCGHAFFLVFSWLLFSLYFDIEIIKQQ